MSAGLEIQRLAGGSLVPMLALPHLFASKQSFMTSDLPSVESLTLQRRLVPYVLEIIDCFRKSAINASY